MSNPGDRWRPTRLASLAIVIAAVAVVVGYCARDADDVAITGVPVEIEAIGEPEGFESPVTDTTALAAKDTETERAALHVRHVGDRIVLEGAVQSAAAKAEFVSAAENAVGADRVDDELVVGAANPLANPEGVIAAFAAATGDWSFSHNSNATVTVTGTVAEDDQREALVRAVRAAVGGSDPGADAIDVEDLLKVASIAATTGVPSTPVVSTLDGTTTTAATPAAPTPTPSPSAVSPTPSTAPPSSTVAVAATSTTP